MRGSERAGEIRFRDQIQRKTESWSASRTTHTLVIIVIRVATHVTHTHTNWGERGFLAYENKHLRKNSLGGILIYIVPCRSINSTYYEYRDKFACSLSSRYVRRDIYLCLPEILYRCRCQCIINEIRALKQFQFSSSSKLSGEREREREREG